MQILLALLASFVIIHVWRCGYVAFGIIRLITKYVDQDLVPSNFIEWVNFIGILAYTFLELFLGNLLYFLLDPEYYTEKFGLYADLIFIDAEEDILNGNID